MKLTRKDFFGGVKGDKTQIAVLYFIKSLILLFIVTTFDFILPRREFKRENADVFGPKNGWFELQSTQNSSVVCGKRVLD